MYAHADAYCIISNSRADAQIPAYMGNDESTHTLCHDVSRVLSSVSLHSLVALEARFSLECLYLYAFVHSGPAHFSRGGG
ncbi:hypothetical protein GQ55_3G234100 [Panicum hallii var. hallii]|uniref:Uncharacterized protein n=1 Tax=Panicum hallii var. hallii TaxID=1504633 RepID=A0A2T7ECK5_9POAL|nr:hypothetical protein GQ55_3G234100 [Panicum hallii var. hallii]